MGGKLGATLVALLFAVPFGAVGAFASYGIGSMVSGSLRANDWVIVQAKVDDAALNRSSGRKGGTTYSASGAYRFTMAGKEYTSDKLGFMPFGGSDNVGDWQEDMAALLQEAKATGKTLPVYVNPDDPAESVVDRGIRWSMVAFMLVFGVLFGGVGIGALAVIIGIWFGKAESPRSRKGKQGRKEVAADLAERNRGAAVNAVEIPSGSSSSVKGLWFFSILWNLISFPIALIAVPEMWRSGEWLGLLVLLFPGLGILMLWSAISQTIGLLRRGKSTLTLANLEPRMGQRLAGAVSYPRFAPGGKQVQIRISAFEGRAADGSQPTSSIARWWRDVKVAPTKAGGGGERLDFAFDLPGRLDVKGIAPGEEAYKLRWTLSVTPRGAHVPTDEFEIAMKPPLEPVDSFTRAGSMQVDPRNEAAMARLFGAAAMAKMSPEQKAAFAELPPGAQKVVAKVANVIGDKDAVDRKISMASRVFTIFFVILVLATIYSVFTQY